MPHGIAMTSMKIDDKKREERFNETVAVDAPTYPWGLSLHLDEDSLEKLGISKLPEVGGTVIVYARANITSVESRESEGGGRGVHKHRSVGLQITDLALLENEDENSKSTEETLYGK